jgi:hypothetical protein
MGWPLELNVIGALRRVSWGLTGFLNQHGNRAPRKERCFIPERPTGNKNNLAPRLDRRDGMRPTPARVRIVVRRRAAVVPGRALV